MQPDPTWVCVNGGWLPPGLAPTCPGPDPFLAIGGGATDPGVLDAAWSALRPGGRMVANGVTLETEALLLARFGAVGGTLTRLHVERAEPIGPGRLHGWRPAMAVTQWRAVKP